MFKNSNWRLSEFDDDFTGPVVKTHWNLIGGSSKGTFAIESTGLYGRGVLTSGATGVFANDLTILNLGSRQIIAHNPLGSFFVEARFKPSSITTNYMFFGVTDDTTTSEAPISSAASADTLTSAATDACGLMFDTAMATDNWWLVGVDTNVDATAQNTAIAPVANQFITVAMGVDITGKATFWYNDVMVGTVMTDAVGTGIGFTPVFAISKNSGAASFSLTIDRVYRRIVRRSDGSDN